MKRNKPESASAIAMRVESYRERQASMNRKRTEFYLTAPEKAALTRQLNALRRSGNDRSC